MSVTTDNFNRANESPIGAPWASITGRDGLQLLSNRCREDVTGAGNASRYTGLSLPGDQYAQGKAVVLSSAGSTEQGPMCRAASGANTFYVAWFRAPEFCWIYKYVDGTSTQLANAGVTVASNDVLRLEVIGTSLEAFINGGSVLTGSDSAIASGDPGYFITNITTGENEMDDWEAGDFVVGGPALSVLSTGRRRRYWVSDVPPR